MVNIILYYLFYCSAVLIYGIGLNRATVLSRSLDRTLFFLLIKNLITILCSTVLTWVIIVELLSPAGLIELYPLAALLVFMAVSVFVEILIRITTGYRTSEFAVSYLVILLALSESTGIISAVVAASSCILSFIIILPVLSALRNRIECARPRNDKMKKKSLIMLSMAVIIISLAVWNVSWLNQGVL
jgi:electron transport complex protein RnfA